MSSYNVDGRTVASFGDEWKRYDQSRLSKAELQRLFDSYFCIFPWNLVAKNAEGFDMGCGSGRFAQLVAPRVGLLHCIDPSAALEVARRNLCDAENIRFHEATIDDTPLEPSSQDFGYSIGVLHHIPDTQAGLDGCVKLLKPGAPFLLYLYYRFDHRPLWFRMLWKITDYARRLISRMPSFLIHRITDLIAVIVYFPLARISGVLKRPNFPLYSYRQASLYTMRTDSRDRFGTPLEKRFFRWEVREMMTRAGLTEIRFSESAPYWVAVGVKK